MVISDIHGNNIALDSVLEDIKQRFSDEEIEGYFFLRDYINDFSYPNEVVERVRQLIAEKPKSVAIAGNKEGYIRGLHGADPNTWLHDQMGAVYWTYNELTEENRKWLLSLEKECTTTLSNGKSVCLYHDCRSLWEVQENSLTRLHNGGFIHPLLENKWTHKEHLQYIQQTLREDPKLGDTLTKIPYDILLLGHTHCQWYAEAFGKIMVNAGSCGLPLDTNCHSAYSVIYIQGDNVWIEEFRVPSDVESVKDTLKSSELYKVAKGWEDMILYHMDTGIDEFHLFFPFATEKAKEWSSSLWNECEPFENDVWNKVCRIWLNEK